MPRSLRLARRAPRERFIPRQVLKALNPGGRPAGAPAPTTSATPSQAASVRPAPTATASGTAFTPEPGPASTFAAGQQIRVPNVGADRIEPGKVEDANWQRTLISGRHSQPRRTASS